MLMFFGMEGTIFFVLLLHNLDVKLCYTDTPRGVTYPYPILIGYADTDTRIHHFSGFSF